MKVVTNLVVVIILQYICVPPNHCAVHLKRTVYAKDTSIKLEKYSQVKG